MLDGQELTHTTVRKLLFTGLAVGHPLEGRLWNIVGDILRFSFWAAVLVGAVRLSIPLIVMLLLPSIISSRPKLSNASF